MGTKDAVLLAVGLAVPLEDRRRGPLAGPVGAAEHGLLANRHLEVEAPATAKLVPWILRSPLRRPPTGVPNVYGEQRFGRFQQGQDSKSPER
jgi:hypothetical protein